MSNDQGGIILHLKADDPAKAMDLLQSQIDVTGAAQVNVQIDRNRNVLHVNVNGVCLLRICRIQEWVVNTIPAIPTHEELVADATRAWQEA